MPKEIIHSRFHDDVGPTGAPMEPTHVSVGWTKGASHVEVSVTNFEVAAMVAAGSPPTGDRSFEGWYTQLDRAGCNRLIASVRKARDQAFGRDE